MERTAEDELKQHVVGREQWYIVKWRKIIVIYTTVGCRNILNRRSKPRTKEKILIKWNNSKIIDLPVTNVGSSTRDVRFENRLEYVRFEPIGVNEWMIFVIWPIFINFGNHISS